MTVLSAIVAFALGAVLGSFGNVLVVRLPRGVSLGGRSSCDGCGRTLGMADLVPMIGAVWQRGIARCCGARFGWSYMLWELLTALLFLAAWSVSPAMPEALTLGVCLWLLVGIARIDAEIQMIPDLLNVGLILAGGLLAVLHGELPLAAVALGLLVFGGQWVLSRGRWIGSGDILLSVGIGLMLRHAELAAAAIILAYILGASVAAGLLLTRRTTMQSAIAFGPFLCIAAIAVALVGDRMIALLLG